MKEGKEKYCGCLYYSSNALSRIMTKLADEAFAPIGLAPSYAFMLMSVNQKPGIQPMELSDHMQLTPSTVTRLIEKLEAKGLANRKSLGRATEVYPTEKSLALQPLIQSSWKSLKERYTEILGEDLTKRLTTDVYEASQKLTI